MTRYVLTDFSDRSESLIKLCEYPTVTTTNLSEIKEIISYLRIPLYQVQEGDNLIIYIVDNRIEEIRGFIAVWRNKDIACINIGEMTIWGMWDETDKVLVTDEFEAGEDGEGNCVMGRRAFNAHGLSGIYSRGLFYRLPDDVAETGVAGRAPAAVCLEQML